MQVKTVWLIALLSVATMAVIVFSVSGVSSVVEIEINSWAFTLASWSFFLSVVVPIVRFLFLLARTRESID